MLRVHIENVLETSKVSLKRKIHTWFDSDEATKAEELLARRGNHYTVEELVFLHGFQLSGHDVCVLDNQEDYTALEIYNAEQAQLRYDAADENLKSYPQ
jgi:hypothetical protein